MRSAQERKDDLNHSDVLRLTTSKQFKIINSLSHHEPQQTGLEGDIYNFDDELEGYTSPDGTVRMTKGVVSVVFIAIAATRGSQPASPKGKARGVRVSHETGGRLVKKNRRTRTKNNNVLLVG